MTDPLDYAEHMTNLRGRLRRALQPRTVEEANLLDWIDLPADQLETLTRMAERARVADDEE